MGFRSVNGGFSIGIPASVRHGFSMALIEIVGLPFLKMGGISMAM